MYTLVSNDGIKKKEKSKKLFKVLGLLFVFIVLGGFCKVAYETYFLITSSLKSLEIKQITFNLLDVTDKAFSFLIEFSGLSVLKYVSIKYKEIHIYRIYDNHVLKLCRTAVKEEGLNKYKFVILFEKNDTLSKYILHDLIENKDINLNVNFNINCGDTFLAFFKKNISFNYTLNLQDILKMKKKSTEPFMRIMKLDFGILVNNNQSSLVIYTQMDALREMVRIIGDFKCSCEVRYKLKSIGLVSGFILPRFIHNGFIAWNVILYKEFTSHISQILNELEEDVYLHTKNCICSNKFINSILKYNSYRFNVSTYLHELFHDVFDNYSDPFNKFMVTYITQQIVDNITNNDIMEAIYSKHSSMSYFIKKVVLNSTEISMLNSTHFLHTMHVNFIFRNIFRVPITVESFGFKGLILDPTKNDVKKVEFAKTYNGKEYGSFKTTIDFQTVQFDVNNRTRNHFFNISSSLQYVDIYTKTYINFKDHNSLFNYAKSLQGNSIKILLLTYSFDIGANTQIGSIRTKIAPLIIPLNFVQNNKKFFNINYNVVNIVYSMILSAFHPKKQLVPINVSIDVTLFENLSLYISSIIIRGNNDFYDTVFYINNATLQKGLNKIDITGFLYLKQNCAKILYDFKLKNYLDNCNIISVNEFHEFCNLYKIKIPF